MSRTRVGKAPSGAGLVRSASDAFDRVRQEVGSRPWWYTAVLVIGFVTLLTAVGVLFFGINAAPREVVTNGQVAPVQSPEFAVALSRLVGASVEEGGTVQILENGDEFLPAHIDNHLVRLSAQNHYQARMDAGVRIYEYQPTFTHMKHTVIDGRWSLIGSPNLNSRSRRLDEENVFGVLDPALGGQLEGLFTDDLRQSREIRSDAWRRRNPFVRILQVASRILDQQS